MQVSEREMTGIADTERQVGGASPRESGRSALSPRPVDAVIFDMDGVVIDTAAAHAAAWKRLFDDYLRDRAARTGEPFEPFDAGADYRWYVDGKPRYDRVKSFLESRGIELPFGDSGDRPEAETVCALGNRKNRYFLAWLADHRVETYAATIRLISALRAAGIRTGIFSSSRNCDAVIANADVHDLFDAKVDGTDLTSLAIPGKPAPAMLLETASRLGASPSRTTVVEDAISGVEAGSAGGFGLVLGVDRDSEIISHLFDEQNPAVMAAIADLLTQAKKTKTHSGICRQAPSDHPEFARFLVAHGIDSISVSPDSFLRVKEEGAAAEGDSLLTGLTAAGGG